MNYELLKDAADALYDHVRVLMRHRYSSAGPHWDNLQNAAMRYNAQRQAAENALLSSRDGHHENCDVNDVNPEGIKKPCNCGRIIPTIFPDDPMKPYD